MAVGFLVDQGMVLPSVGGGSNGPAAAINNQSCRLVFCVHVIPGFILGAVHRA
jgi:hypothetical protein